VWEEKNKRPDTGGYIIPEQYAEDLVKLAKSKKSFIGKTVVVKRPRIIKGRRVHYKLKNG
jgi:hypothetical protein